MSSRGFSARAQAAAAVNNQEKSSTRIPTSSQSNTYGVKSSGCTVVVDARLVGTCHMRVAVRPDV